MNRYIYDSFSILPSSKEKTIFEVNMAAASCVSLMGKGIVKPLSPTPSSKRTHKLSFTDKVINDEFIPMAFLYPNKGPSTPNTQSQISQHLQESLSKTLTSYYPFAGTLIGNTHVDCDDRGVEFQQVRFNCPMSEIVNLPRSQFENSLFPKNLPWSSVDKQTLAVVQLSHFECGGIAISVCLTHKVGDGASLVNFIKDWASVSRDSSSLPQPQFIGASLFPPVGDTGSKDVIDPQRDSCVAKGYRFSASNLDSLKKRIINSASAHGSKIKRLSSVDAVSSLLYRALNNKQKPSVLSQVVNLRSRTSIVPENLIGNACTFFTVQAASEEEMELHKLASETEKAKKEVYDKLNNITRDELASTLYKNVMKVFETIQGKEIDIYSVSSFYKMPTHDIDFGWGKPIRMVIPKFRAVKNYIILNDNLSGDGIEAMVNIEKTNVSAFESNTELLEFASPC